jgi:transposase
MPTTPLFPLPDGLEITSISETAEGLLVRVTSNRPTSLCPLCSTPSSAIHSSYRRHPLDLPCAGQGVRLLLSVRKFFCRVACCPRKIFTERIPELLEPSSRLSSRLRAVIQAIGFDFNGKGGARLGEQLGIHLSRPTFLRSLHLVPTQACEQVRVVGLDDFAWKRGSRYGTIILDLETHTVIDLLADREAESVKKWLEAHPEVELVSRDRAGAYADGVARGAPQAQQIADKWHLAKNLGDAVEEYLKRKRVQICADEPQQVSSSTPASSSQASHTPQARELVMCEGEQMRNQRQDLWEQAHALHEQGYGVRTIAKLLGIARNTVRRYLKMDDGWQAAPRSKRRSLLDPYRDYLLSRWMQGEHNGNQLTREIRAQGYQGCDTLVRAFTTQLRKTYPDVAAVPRKHPTSEPSPPLPALSPKPCSPRELRWLLAKKPEKLDQEEQAALFRLLEGSEEVCVVYRLLQSFLQMIRARQAEGLNAWMKEARSSRIKELQSFVAGIERDYDAVKAGLSLHWSQGPVEGTVNKLTVHKRLMYGRAGFPLLRQKMLHCS